MIEFPYGIADFHRIRQEGRLYVDRTAHIRDVERLGDVLVFLRPRRFGKSLWVQTLANYYDLRRENEFEDLFGNLAIGKLPTSLRNRYFVLQWNFSSVSAGGSAREIAESLHRHVSSQAEAFFSDYEGYLALPAQVSGTPDEILSSLLSAVRKTPYKLYLLIDEYDNFVNEVMAKDIDTYRALFDKDGPFKELFKRVKVAMEGQGLERVFITGVSPVALNDLTSGFNIAEDVSLDPSLAGLCGFSEVELRGLLQIIAGEQPLNTVELEQQIGVMQRWYNGYRFSEDGNDLVYNPTNTLFFLKHLYLHGKPPRRLHDENLRTDHRKLAFLAHTAAGTDVIERLTQGDGEIEIPRLETSFSLSNLTARLEKDRGAVASFLYFMGLLTLSDGLDRLRIPNLVVRKLFLDRLLEIVLPGLEDSYEAREVAMRFFQNGDLDPLLAFVDRKLLPVLSNRDLGAEPRTPGQSGSGVNETAIKTLFLSMLFDDTRYMIHSELEVERNYVDLCLLSRQEIRRPGDFDLLFEFKLVRLKELGKKGSELRTLEEETLRKLTPIADAFATGRDQVRRYRSALGKQHSEEMNLRGYVVVVAGLERILGEEVSSNPR